MHDLPVIFIFDLDNTILGDVSSVISYNNFSKYIKYACKSKKLSDNLCKTKVSPYSSSKMLETIRPGFAEFIQSIQKNFPTAELFIYSAGTNDYVNMNIKFLEEYIGKKTFNRPLFSRTECFIDESNNYAKNVSYHLPTMVNILKSKYKILQRKDINPQELLKDRIIFIDDRDVVWDMANKCVKCPKYSYYQICSLDDSTLRVIYKEDLIQKFILNDQSITLYADEETNKSTSFDEFKMRYHLFMANTYQQRLATNKEALNDTFFHKFEKAIRSYANHVKPFTDEHIKKIQKLVNQ